MFAGYEGVVARTWVDAPAGGDAAVPSPGQRKLFGRWSKLWEHLASACRPGRTASDLLAAYERAGEPLPAMPVAHGVGLGMDPPLFGVGLPTDAGRNTVLQPGMVLFVVGQVTDPGVGAVLAGETVLITDSGHELLTGHGHGPLSESGS
jgi:Xaa-Pro dipeptidase